MLNTCGISVYDFGEIRNRNFYLISYMIKLHFSCNFCYSRVKKYSTNAPRPDVKNNQVLLMVQKKTFTGEINIVLPIQILATSALRGVGYFKYILNIFIQKILFLRKHSYSGDFRSFWFEDYVLPTGKQWEIGLYTTFWCLVEIIWAMMRIWNHVLQIMECLGSW